MIRIGSTINGYTVLTAALMHRPDLPDHVVILAHDAKRKHSQYVVAGVSLDPAPTEWDFGSYSSTPEKAVGDFMRRSELRSFLPEPTIHRHHKSVPELLDCPQCSQALAELTALSS